MHQLFRLMSVPQNITALLKRSNAVGTELERPCLIKQ